MAVCFFTYKCYDGSGDIAHTVKIADFIDQLIRTHNINQEVIIVVPDKDDRKYFDDNKAIVSRFVAHINPSLKVKTFSEFKAEKINMDCCIEAGYTIPDWENELGYPIEKLRPPVIKIPEYNNNLFMERGHYRIRGGFDMENGDLGVIPCNDLLEATTSEVIPREVLNKAFDNLDKKISKYLGGNFDNYLEHRATHQLTYEYSNYQPKGDKSDTHRMPRPITLFLREHYILAGGSLKSQDVLFLGGNSKVKRKALKGELPRLSESFTKILWVDLDHETEEILYQSDDHSGKEYRVFYSRAVSFSTMKALPLFADKFVGATGDNSFVEAMSAGKLVSYQCQGHKQSFASGYLKAVRKETKNPQVVQLAEFLMKGSIFKYDEKIIEDLLKDVELVEELRAINRTIILKSGYFKGIEDAFRSAISDDKKNFHLDPKKSKTLYGLLKSLHKIILINKKKSEEWCLRFSAAEEIISRLSSLEHEPRGAVISVEEIQFITNKLKTIKDNKPSWFEQRLIVQIFDVLSLGIIPLIRHFFFEDNTIETLNKIDSMMPDNTVSHIDVT